MPESSNHLHTTLEPNTHNKDACTVVLYFRREPGETEVVNTLARARGDFPLFCDPDDEDFSYEEHSTPVSDLAHCRRYECYPTG